MCAVQLGDGPEICHALQQVVFFVLHGIVLVVFVIVIDYLRRGSLGHGLLLPLAEEGFQSVGATNGLLGLPARPSTAGSPVPQPAVYTASACRRARPADPPG
jgi:hypothetical protein